MAQDFTAASYYFPNYHVDARNEAQHGPGWAEWELVKEARPRFDGHHQPNVPQWGYLDEANPADMAKKIDAAADHGIGAFIFDWYYYDDGPFLQRGLEEGFLKAPNNDRLRCGLMWANHNWVDIHPARLGKTPDLLYPGPVTTDTFDRMTDYIVEAYFPHPSYWKIEGCPYFSVYELHTLLQGLGGIENTAKALNRFREKTQAAGFPDLHLNTVTFGVRILPGETAVSKPEELVNLLGFDSVTSYVWIHDVGLWEFPQTPYREVLARMKERWEAAAATYRVPYHPNVTMGWDASPRCHQDDPLENRGYPFMASMSGNTPEAFEDALRALRDFLEKHPGCDNTFTINCWNEWTEGSYLEPDECHGMAYLEAIRTVFGT